ncbi:hypothetical protein [Rufibacter tibetensis]|uniref:Uncharacterized protein n=1 Tax=Rufibacter tibetensis TaxID=512763 RepID=A0A0P0CTN8_9BACT|nr:hypothetical protein [Rufibacter tibetensis]ALI99985.1 hypothetical protein DC20_14635 [Rufibacter tibetensis]
MRLNIYQEERKYQFYRNDEDSPYLTGEVFWASSKKPFGEIYDLENRPVAILMNGESSSFWKKGKPTYFLYLDSEVVEVTVVSIWKGHWAFEYKGFHYNFYWHNGYKKSLFKSGEQVAKYDARESYPLDPKKAFIVANNDEDHVLLLGLFLLFDKGSALDSELPRNSAYLGRGVQECDYYWFPKR